MQLGGKAYAVLASIQRGPHEQLLNSEHIWMTEFITTAVQIRRVITWTPNIAQSIGYSLIPQ
jgi:hypothetical protein